MRSAQNQKLFETLVDGQNPLALFITCSDSRIDPNRLTQTKPGELFIQRTAGNIIPPYGAVHGGEAATIEYAVMALEGQRHRGLRPFSLRSDGRFARSGER